METRAKDKGHERSDPAQTLSECAVLIACVVEGAVARKRNIDRAQNPHLVALRDDSMTASEGDRQSSMAEAWWDGWEELNLVMRSAVASPPTCA